MLGGQRPPWTLDFLSQGPQKAFYYYDDDDDNLYYYDYEYDYECNEYNEYNEYNA